MSEDAFKQYVNTHREEFETSSQDFEHMWRHIEKGLDTNTGKPWTAWIKIAASLLILAAVGWYVVSTEIEAQMPEELAETEQHYIRLINLKMAEVVAHQNNVDAMIWEDLEILDDAYLELKSDLRERFDQEEVAQAMIENQRAKLEILEHILNEIESKVDDEAVESLDL
ncbi:MAG: hypothetical protein DHS20C17_36320 [Cyclobacteriaceae bacterium]|nr:MAG: hypothetical protein DHS20C17_36320 [Cyclobacteriaceae bacterium]